MNTKTRNIIIIAATLFVAVTFFWDFLVGSFFGGTTTEEPVTTTQPSMNDYGLRSISVEESQLQSTPEGIRVADITPGTGADSVVGAQLTVHYVGRFTNGQIFDTSLDRGEPLIFTLGAGQVIRGWDLGMQNMKVGGVRRLIIPPELAYGAGGIKMPDGTEIIPANSTLVFDVVLLDVAQKSQ